MPQAFARWANSASKISLFGAVLGLAVVAWACIVFTQSSYGTSAGVVEVQPVPFSHEHHVGILGIDCRYCHTTVENSSFAGVPPTKTCMNCHSQMWVQSQMLRPVRQSYDENEPIAWRRVYNTPGFVYFSHEIHIHKGIGCSSCHGRIDHMPFTFQEPSLLMQWCIDCHRDPAQQIRPVEAVFDMHYQFPANQQELGRSLVKEYHIRDPQFLTSCSVCHR
jgi:hypothetical protein